MFDKVPTLAALKGDAKKTHIIRVLGEMIPWGFISIFCLGIIGIIFTFNNKIAGSSFVAVLLVAYLISWRLLKFGRLLSAVFIFLASHWIVVTLAVFLGHGIESPLTSQWLVLVAIAGILVGRKAALISTIVAVVLGILVSVLEYTSLSPLHLLALPPLSALIIFLYSAGMLGLVVALSAKVVQETSKDRELTEKEYQRLVENIQETVFLLDPQGKVNYVSPSLETMLGFLPNDILGNHFSELIDKKDLPKALNDFEKVLSEKKHLVTERTLQDKEGRRRSVICSLTPIIEKDQAIGIQGIATDITLRKAAELALSESEEQYRRLIEDSIDGIAILQNERFLFANQSFLSMFDFKTKEQLYEKPLPELIQTGSEGIEDILTKSSLYTKLTSHDVKGIRQDGGMLDIELSFGRVSFKGESALQIIAHDVSKRKRQEELQMTFIDNIVRSRDDDRERLAIELHDELGAALTSISLGIRSLAYMKNKKKSLERIESLRSLTEDTIKRVGHIARGLHPVLLERYGLLVALREHIKEAQDIHEQNIDLHIVDLPESLGKEKDLAVFRIVQEGLANAIKHAKANNVSIIVDSDISTIRITVEDDGVGIEAPLELDENENGSLGLFGIKQRLASLKGNLSIEPTPGGGTTLLATIPGEIHERE
jgi:PAS domain S-box-containing protein